MYNCVPRITKSRSILGYHIEHWLDIRRRAGNHTQDLAGSGLLLQRLGEFLKSRTFSMAMTA
jgi:hypothetical protein